MYSLFNLLFDFDIRQTNIALLISMFPLTIILRYWLVYLGWHVARHSDGVGHEAGSSYSYHPRLKPEHSLNADENEMAPNYVLMGNRGKFAWTIFTLAIAPLTVLLQLCELLILHFIPRFEYWLSYGKSFDNNFPVDQWTFK